MYNYTQLACYPFNTLTQWIYNFMTNYIQSNSSLNIPPRPRPCPITSLESTHTLHIYTTHLTTATIHSFVSWPHAICTAACHEQSTSILWVLVVLAIITNTTNTHKIKRHTKSHAPLEHLPYNINKGYFKKCHTGKPYMQARLYAGWAAGANYNCM